MPNWCDNTISISGPTSSLEKLIEAIDHKGDNLLETMNPIGDWDYGLAVEAWGTKWDVSTDNLHYEEGDPGIMLIYGSFMSAWGPPLEAFMHFAKEHLGVHVEISYFEPGMAFVGDWDSETKVNEHYEIDEENLDEIPERLCDMFDLKYFYEKEDEYDD